MATASPYGRAMRKFLDGGINLTSDTIKVSLHTVTYTPNFDTNEFFTDATNELATAGGYTAGGVTLATKVTAYDATNDRATFDCDDVTWTAATFTCRYAVIRKDTGSSATSPLIGWIDFTTNQSPSAVDFVLQIDPTGLIRMS
jgi:hypothetical protein